MINDQYEAWIKSHQRQVNDVDMADAVMNRVTKRAVKPHIFRRTWETIPLDLIQVRTWMRISIIVCGAVMSLLRMLVQFYSVLFT